MMLRDALTQQAPSLALQRSASDEIARLDAKLMRLIHEHDDLRAALLATVQALVPPPLQSPIGLSHCSTPWPQVARALWPEATP